MARNTKQRTWLHTCQNCGKKFSSLSKQSKTCSNACRIKKHRDEKRGDGKSWQFVRPEYASKASQILKLSPSAYDAIYAVLGMYGAIAAEYAIAAAYDAATACLAVQEAGVK